jgi:hypothetical protein
MGTDLQNVFDAFFIKNPSANFTGKETQVFQLFKSAIAQCYRRVYDNLEYVYEELLNEGSFTNVVTQPTIELISMYMTIEYCRQKLSLLSGRKQYIGTQAFNKIPSLKEEVESATTLLHNWENKLQIFLNEFPDYSDER